jgi:membrane protease YdiL (CAAX protease family)
MSAAPVAGLPVNTPRWRLRALFSFLLAIIYFHFAGLVAAMAARGLSSSVTGFHLVYQLLMLFLLLVGYSAMGYAFQRQTEPVRGMGLMRRAGQWREFAVGAAVGWGLMIACVLPIVLFGGYTLTVWTSSGQYAVLVVDLLILLLGALVEEIAFRGYPFQRLIDAVGPVSATLLMSPVFALIHLSNPDWTPMSMVVTIVAGWLLSIAYLRTRALWLPWGLHFGWNVSLGVIFGLPISGLTNFSPIIQSNTAGPIWLTGDGYGPEGSFITGLVLVIGLFVLTRVTRGYAHLYAHPVIVAAGIPVDIDAVARRQHEAAMGPATPAGPTLVQIAPAPTVPVEFTGAAEAVEPPLSSPEVTSAEYSAESDRPADSASHNAPQGHE